MAPIAVLPCKTVTANMRKPAASCRLRSRRSARCTQMIRASVSNTTEITAAVLSPEQGFELLDGLDTLILDCDGVLWRGNTLLPNTVEALQAFRSLGKRLLFVTNNASKSRQQYVSKFAGLGIPVTAEEIVSSSYAAAAYLAEHHHRHQQQRGVRGNGSSTEAGNGGADNGGAGICFMIGTDGLRQELELAGLRCVSYDDLGLPQPLPVDQFAAHVLDADISSVVVGWDGAFHFGQLCLASACIREIPGCLFVVTNPDTGDRIGDGGRLMPGTGCLVEAVAAVAGVRPTVVGKGGDWLLPHLQSLYNLDPSKTAVVGDRLDTDVAMGRQGGMMTVLTLTGVSTLEEACGAEDQDRPHVIAPSLATLAGLP